MYVVYINYAISGFILYRLNYTVHTTLRNENLRNIPTGLFANPMKVLEGLSETLGPVTSDH